MTQILQNGSKWPLEPLNEDSKRADVNKALAFGNHKGALMQPELLKKLVSKDVHFGYCLLLLLTKSNKYSRHSHHAHEHTETKHNQ
jgi:hypothetical protein